LSEQNELVQVYSPGLFLLAAFLTRISIDFALEANLYYFSSVKHHPGL